MLRTRGRAGEAGGARTSRPGPRSLILLASLAGLAAAAQAAPLPEWAQAVREGAPQLPAGSPSQPYRLLLSEVRLEVRGDGRFQVDRRIAAQALSARSEGIEARVFPFDEGRRVRTARAWLVPPGGAPEKRGVDGHDVEVAGASDSDALVRDVRIGRPVDRGSLVFLEFESLEEPETLSFRWLFLEYAETSVARLEVAVPAGWTVRHAWPRGEALPRRTAGGGLSWEFHDLPSPRFEPLGEDPRDAAPLLVLGFDPPGGAAVAAVPLPDWRAVGAWYESLVEGRDKVTAEVAIAAKRAVAAAGRDAASRTKAVGRYVRDTVRYVAKEIGLGAYQPRPASRVLADLWGDCKDKGTLLRALLRAEGFVSYPILVNRTRSRTVAEEVPTPLSFNHFVVGVVLPGEPASPSPLAHATVDAGDLGRLVVVDPTDELRSVGFLSASLAGKRALVVAGEQSRLVTLPGSDADAHRADRRLTVSTRPDGTTRMRVVTTLTGEPAARARAQLRASQVDRRRAVEGRVAATWLGATIEEYRVVPEREDGTFVETQAWTVPAGAWCAGGSAPLFEGALEAVEPPALAARSGPVDFGHAVTLRFETVLEGLVDVAPPPAEEARGDGWRVRSAFERDGDGLTGIWTFVRERTRFDRGAFEELRAMAVAAQRIASASVTCGKPSGSGLDR